MRHVVTDADTAVALGSGDVPVLGTPRLIAWMEAETVAEAAARLDANQTTVGTSIRIDHRRPSFVGGSIDVSATLTATERRRLTFAVQAVDAAGKVVGDGEITRVVVDRSTFLANRPLPHT